MSAIMNLVIRDNADFVEPFAWVDANDDPYDWTGYTFAMDVRVDPSDVTAVLSLTTANGGIASSDLSNSTITINIGSGVIDPGTYVYDLLKISSGNVRETLAYGKMIVVDGVTA